MNTNISRSASSEAGCIRRRFSPLVTLIAGLSGMLLVWQFEPTARAATIVESAKVEDVWSGVQAGFSLLTDGNRQYVAYYDAQRQLTVASRTLDSTTWTYKRLPTWFAWDGHNYVTMALDKDGQLHVSGNMHCVPLLYFRTSTAGDVSTLTQYRHMVGNLEDMTTYPRFFHNKEGSLIFCYRTGSSGDGDVIYNIYDTESRTWRRLIDTSLIDGEGERNAYVREPVLGPDGYWYLTWIWRDTTNVETCHDPSCARSRDLIHWETVDGKPLTLPLRYSTPDLIIDPVPTNGGIVNGSAKISFDKQGRPVIAYQKFDESGATQIYLNRYENGAWVPRKLTNWTWRWEPFGGGSVSFDVTTSELKYAPSIGHYISLSNKKHGGGDWLVDPETLTLGDKIPREEVPGYLPNEAAPQLVPGMTARWAVDLTRTPGKLRYVLRSQARPGNRDRPLPGPIPAPTSLDVLAIDDSQ